MRFPVQVHASGSGTGGDFPRLGMLLWESRHSALSLFGVYIGVCLFWLTTMWFDYSPSLSPSGASTSRKEEEENMWWQ